MATTKAPAIYHESEMGAKGSEASRKYMFKLETGRHDKSEVIKKVCKAPKTLLAALVVDLLPFMYDRVPVADFFEYMRVLPEHGIHDVIDAKA